MVNFDRVDGGVIRTAFKAGLRISIMNLVALFLFVFGMKYYFMPEFREDANAFLDRQIHVETWPINSTERNSGHVIKSVSFNHELESLLKWSGRVKLSETEVVFIGNKTEVP